MPIQHVVWDWNGTLLDDLEIVIESLNVGIGLLGHQPISEDEYRTHFTRPVRAFYDSLLGRRVSDMEWELLNNTFHEEYFTRVDKAHLTTDALLAIESVENRGWTQSILSMTAHDKLVEIVGVHGIGGRFLRVQGLTEGTGGLKAVHLDRHIKLVGVDPAGTLVVGDTPDDADAALEVGAQVVLYDGGSHHLPTLQATTAPVAHTLISALGVLV